MKSKRNKVTQDTIDKYHLLKTANIKGLMMEKILGVSAPTISVIKNFKTLEEYNKYNRDKARVYMSKKGKAVTGSEDQHTRPVTQFDQYNTIIVKLNALEFGMKQLEAKLASKKIIF
jgi:hypothetical protein